MPNLENTNPEEWAGTFREIHDQILDYEGVDLTRDVLLPSLPDFRKRLALLHRYQKRNTPDHPYQVEREDLWEWYALSRINDVLLDSFQSIEEKLGCGLSLQQYFHFFTTLSFVSFVEPRFHPFLHEIVEAIEDPACGDQVQIEHVFWPGLMWGDLLFARSGVRVRAPRKLICADIAMRTPLYFTHHRLHRLTSDPSLGWGSNSQWRTDFRRDYRDSGQVHYNVDGHLYLDDTYAEQSERKMPGLGADKLTVDQRQELLIHRSFVRTPEFNQHLWPFDDRWSQPLL